MPPNSDGPRPGSQLLDMHRTVRRQITPKPVDDRFVLDGSGGDRSGPAASVVTVGEAAHLGGTAGVFEYPVILFRLAGKAAKIVLTDNEQEWCRAVCGVRQGRTLRVKAGSLIGTLLPERVRNPPW